jgi:hypothetical protein
MAIMMVMHVKGGTLEQYDQATKEVFDGTLQPAQLPDGLLSHTAAKSDDGIKVVDVWESKEKFDAFGAKLMPALQHANMPEVQPMIYEVHNFLKA